MNDPAEVLGKFKPEKEFFIGIDSDGCAFDTMEIKHKECFCPAFINHFQLQAVSKYAREAWEFVNLYSKTRGCNRFLAVIHVLDLLAERSEIKNRGVTIPDVKSLKRWVKRENRLGNPALKIELEKTPDSELQIVYDWSIDVNETIGRIVHNVPPFPLVRESLINLIKDADAIVVSQTTLEALEREWNEHNISRYARLIAGQEMGTKTEHLEFTSKGKYPADHILMIGDAPGDLKAAKANNALFFPINPGHEEDSWRRFYNDGLKRFLSGTYSGSFEKGLIDKFHQFLPENPPWIE